MLYTFSTQFSFNFVTSFLFCLSYRHKYTSDITYSVVDTWKMFPAFRFQFRSICGNFVSIVTLIQMGSMFDCFSLYLGHSSRLVLRAKLTKIII